MAIKKNAQKLLLALYCDQRQSPVVIPSDKLKVVVPDMSTGGYRSLLLFLEQKHLLYREKIFGTVSIGITEEGREVLSSLFPALSSSWSSWNDQWMVMVFLDAPKSDPSFRYLRKLLLSEKALALSRGVYLAAKTFSHRILIETKQLYTQSVAILSADTWLLGLERPVIVKYYDLASRAEAYSGISGEVARLLATKDDGKKFTDQQKMHIHSIIDRLLESLRDDPGFTTHYFPGVPEVRQILSQLQKIL